MMNFRFLFLAFTCMLISMSGFATDFVGKETASFRITTRGDSVGTLHLKRWMVGDTMVYEYNSEALVKFFGTHHVISYKLCKYVGKKMVYSNSYHHENGNLKDSVVLHWRGSYYDVLENGDKDKIDKLVEFGTICFFFNEPVNIPMTFAEVKLDFMPLTCTAKGCYTADGGWGKKSNYVYKNGKLVNAEINSPIINFQLHRIAG